MATPSADRCALLQVVGLWAERSVSMCLQTAVAHWLERRWALHSRPCAAEHPLRKRLVLLSPL